MRIRSILPAFFLGILACSRGGSQHVERLTRGDTTIVRTSGDGTWGRSRDAVEDKRAGNDATVAFGELNSATVLPNGGVLVFDAKALNGPSLELFDSTAKLIGPVGHAGNGPGGYQLGLAVSVAAAPNGTMLVLDPQNQRVDRFAASGRPLSPIPVASVSANGAPEFLRAGAAGTVYVWSYVDRTRGLRIPEMTGYIHYDSTGLVIDTIPAQHTWLAADPVSPADPHEQWSALDDGRVLMSRTDLTGFLVRPAVGNTGMTRVELAVEPAMIAPEERREIQAMVDAWPQGRLPDGSPAPRMIVPDHKPAIRAVMTDLDGRIWLQRNVASIRVPPHPAPGAPNLQQTFDQPTVWSAFRPDGSYLGEVRFPPGIRVFGFVRDIAWAVTRDKNDAQRLVRYRIPGIAGK